MADLIYDTSEGILAWPAKNLEWEATSGPYGAGILPMGLYTVSRREITEYTSSVDIPYRDKTGRGFFVPIYPQFKTNRGKDNRLGIHPDGNIPGTSGCIGITEYNAKSFHDAIKITAPSANITLVVM